MTEPLQLPLRDIHLPDPVSWWPPGPGWWLLPLLLGVSLWVARRLDRYWRGRRRAARLRRAALRELDALEMRYRASGDTRAAVAGTSVLLRRVALSIAPRKEVAALTGERWLQWLRQRRDIRDLGSTAAEALVELPYHPNPQLDVAALLAECRALIDSARPKSAGVP